MKVYNLEKTQILENYDLTKGYLTEDTITTHYPAVQGRKGRGHYETLREYPNGGKDVKWVVDVEEIKAEEAHDVVEDIYVFHPYETADLQKIEAEKEIISLKQKLAKLKQSERLMSKKSQTKQPTKALKELKMSHSIIPFSQ